MSNNITQNRITLNFVKPNFKSAIVTQTQYELNILQALQNINFKYHRRCSYSDLIRVKFITNLSLYKIYNNIRFLKGLATLRDVV